MFSQRKTAEIVDKIKVSFAKNKFDIDSALTGMAHFEAIKQRKAGKVFTFSEHLSGLIYSLLSNQRPWKPIAENQNNINKIFYQFDKDEIKATKKDFFIRDIRGIKCGNRAIVRQMTSLDYNIKVFEKIEEDYGSIDSFITSDSYQNIANELAQGKKYKLKQIGIPLALEYLRNVGIDTLKPDVHILRILGRERLGFFEGYPNETEAITIMQYISEVTGLGLAYLDGLLWNFCSDGGAGICANKPKCHLCELAGHCKYAINLFKQQSADKRETSMLKATVLNKAEMQKISDINFHDAEISKIICDYDAGTVEMPIIMDDTHRYNALIKFEQVIYIEVKRKEPWGPGVYIFSLNIENSEEDCFRVSILLNSGDEVIIIASKMIYTSNG